MEENTQADAAHDKAKVHFVHLEHTTAEGHALAEADDVSALAQARTNAPAALQPDLDQTNHGMNPQL